MSEQNGSPVVVTTEHRGVFFGYLRGSRDGKIVELSQARMCLYWSSAVRGILGLAVTGPVSGCRVGPAVSTLTLQGVTAVMDVRQEAVKLWEAASWS